MNTLDSFATALNNCSMIATKFDIFNNDDIDILDQLIHHDFIISHSNVFDNMDKLCEMAILIENICNRSKFKFIKDDSYYNNKIRKYTYNDIECTNMISIENACDGYIPPKNAKTTHFTDLVIALNGINIEFDYVISHVITKIRRHYKMFYNGFMSAAMNHNTFANRTENRHKMDFIELELYREKQHYNDMNILADMNNITINMHKDALIDRRIIVNTYKYKYFRFIYNKKSITQLIWV